MLTTFTSYELIASNLTRSLARTASEPVVSRETEYYLANIGKVKSIDGFLADNRLFSYAMKAFGLDDMSYAKAFMRKVLEDGVDSSDSFANKLTDKRYLEFAKVFNFKDYGAQTTTFYDAQQGTVDRYVRQTLEDEAGQQNEGVQLALYFQRKASSITSGYSILADKALLQVVQTVLRLPASSSQADIDQQAKMIENRIDLKSLQDPSKLQKFLQRFTALWDIDNPTTTNTIMTLFSTTSSTNVSADLLATIQNLKLGGS